jgi:hypothetical protein
MQNELLINKQEIDATAATTINRESTEQKIIDYFSFGRYKVGLIEDENRRVLGIYSIEVVKDFYDIDQLAGHYWDPEDYYD